MKTQINGTSLLAPVQLIRRGRAGKMLLIGAAVIALTIFVTLVNLAASSAQEVAAQPKTPCFPHVIVNNDTDSPIAKRTNLREAIFDVCAGGTITFELPSGDTIKLTQGELLIAKAMTISGPGVNNLFISGELNSRVFHITHETEGVKITNLTIEKGIVHGPNPQSVEAGGGILIDTNAPVTLETVKLDSNEADQGGGIRNSGILTIKSGSQLSNNKTCSFPGPGAICPPGLGGGGLGGGAISNDGGLTVTNSHIGPNNRAGSGGGIHNFAQGVVVLIDNTNIDGNIAFVVGAGIENDGQGSIKITNSNIVGNQAPSGGGGGIGNAGALEIANSDIHENFARAPGGGIANGGTITITNSSIHGNGVHNFGAGLYNFGTVNIVNGTQIYANSAEESGGGIYNGGNVVIENANIHDNKAFVAGGGIENFGGSVSITSSSIQNNSAGAGGGITDLNGGQLYITQSDIRNNIAQGANAKDIYVKPSQTFP